MKKIVLPVLLLLISCSTVKVKENQFSPSKIHIAMAYDEKTKINGLYLYEPVVVKTNVDATDDLSGDLVPVSKDATNDRVEKERSEDTAPKKINEKEKKITFIDDPHKREYYFSQFKKVESDIHKKLFENSAKYKLNTELYKYQPDSTDDVKLLLTIKIKDYTEGEYNLINNTNTRIKYEVTIQNKEEKVIAKFNKSYIVVTDFEYPLELLRLTQINRVLSKDITDLIIRVLKKTNR